MITRNKIKNGFTEVKENRKECMQVVEIRKKFNWIIVSTFPVANSKRRNNYEMFH